MEFKKLNDCQRNLPNRELHDRATNMQYGALEIIDILTTPSAIQNHIPWSIPSKKGKKLKKEHYSRTT